MAKLYWNVLVFVLYGAYIVNGDSQPEVTIAQGVLRGKYTYTFKNRQIASFEGIPFAKPPVGELRFKEPVPADPWTGTLEATEPPTECIQYGGLVPGQEPVMGSEDCLYINVYTPQVSITDQPKLLDVIAYIHGGGLTMGKSSDHGPSLILDRDFVFVTFNYRLGPIGFLSTEDNVVPGNNGLKDQALALKWIQQNIAAFGGNPKSVTLGGLSAGSAGCSFQLLSPLSKGLFKGAVCMSGVAINPWATAEKSREKAMSLATYLDCPTDDSATMIGCLRTKPAKDIVTLIRKFMYNDAIPFAPFGPVVEPISENAFISDSPLNIIKEKKGSDVPVVFSYCLDEGALMLTNPPYLNALRDYSTDSFEVVLEYNYTVQIAKRTEIRKRIEKFYKMDSEDIQPFVNVYNYPNATHASDAPYTIGIQFLGNPPQDQNDIQLTEEMHDMWVSFAANGKLEGNWQPVQEQLPNIVFTDIRGPGDFQLTVEDELGEESFWDSLGLNENIGTSANSHEEL